MYFYAFWIRGFSCSLALVIIRVFEGTLATNEPCCLLRFVGRYGFVERLWNGWEWQTFGKKHGLYLRRNISSRRSCIILFSHCVFNHSCWSLFRSRGLITSYVSLTHFVVQQYIDHRQMRRGVESVKECHAEWFSTSFCFCPHLISP